jgi:beta-N-acetylhexosaminidase
LWTGSPDPGLIAQAVSAARAADVTVVTTYNAWADPTQQDLVNALLAACKPVVVASVGGPYDIAHFPSAPTYLAAYGYQPVSVAALADTLFGTDPTGRLPVTIPTPDGSQVLFPFGSGVGY